MAIDNESEAVLHKTNRINFLFDFYAHLLTERQYTFLKLYYHDNLSLAEIAEQFNISRQAINEHIKRAEAIIEQYEEKLQMLAKHERRLQYFEQIKGFILKLEHEDQQEAMHVLDQLIQLELR